MSKKVGVLFSGGLDSTYLVWKNLEDGNEVVPIYIEITNNTTKSIIEKNRIELLYHKFADEFNIDDKHRIDHIQYVVTVDVCASEDSLYFKQVPVWVLGLMFCQSMGLDEIQIGYVGNDDAIPYLEDIKKIYKSYNVIQRKLVPLVFPLAKENKFIIAPNLPTKYRDLIYSCENPRIVGSEEAEIINYEPCGSCASCQTIINGDYYGLGFPQIYKEKVIELRIRELSRDGYKITDKEGNDVDGWQSEKVAPQPYQQELPFEMEWGQSVDLPNKAEAVKEKN